MLFLTDKQEDKKLNMFSNMIFTSIDDYNSLDITNLNNMVSHFVNENLSCTP